MAKEVVHKQVNAVLIAGDGWHAAAAGSYENDGHVFTFVTASGPAIGSMVIGKAVEVQAVRMTKS